MRLLYVTSSFPHGPGEAFILPEVRALLRLGIEIWVVPMHPRGRIVHKEALQLGDRLIVRPLLSLEVLRDACRSVFRSPQRALRALALLLTWNPRHLLKNLSVYAKGLWLAGLARRLAADHIHCHWAATTASMAMVASRVSGVPWSFTAHRWDIVENNLLARKCADAAFVRFISRNGLELASRRGLHRSDRVRVLHMGVELPSRVLVDSETARPRSGALTVLCAASFIARKGHTYLIQAVARLIEQGTKVRLLLAGDGELRSALEDQVARSNLSQWVAILGYVPHEKLLELYVREDIGAFVLPSLGLDGEGIPVSLMEAMAFGVPVISTETGGIPELLGGGAGIIVPPADPAALAAAIARLAADPDLRRRLGERGRERVEEAFSVQAVARCLAGWFAEGIEE